MPCTFHTQGEWMVCPDWIVKYVFSIGNTESWRNWETAKRKTGMSDHDGASHAPSLLRQSSSRRMMPFFCTLVTF